MDYDLFHDESRVTGRWHGMLLIPHNYKLEILRLLRLARAFSGYQGPIGFKNLNLRNARYHCALAWVSIAVAALRSRTGDINCPIFLGKVGHYELHPQCWGAKFILFREDANYAGANVNPDYGKCNEINDKLDCTKNGGHALGEPERFVIIKRLVFDSRKHFKRHLNRDSIILKLMGLKDHFCVSDVFHDVPSNHSNLPFDYYSDCQFMQLTDLLIGCFRTALGLQISNIRHELALPAIDLIRTVRSGKEGLKISRWRDSLWVCQCHLQDGKWIFETLNFSELDKHGQLDIFN